MHRFSVKDLALNAILGAAYVVLVFVFQFLSFELIQFRIAEALLILVLFNAKLSFGLTLGTFVANLIFSPFGYLDAIIGTIATIIAIIMMISLKKIPWIALLMPAIFNGIIVGYFIYFTSLQDTTIPFLTAFIWVFLGEFIVLYLLGIPSFYYINKNEQIKELLINKVA